MRRASWLQSPRFLAALFLVAVVAPFVLLLAIGWRLLERDHKSAIEEYRSIHARAGSNTRVAVQALLQLAESYTALKDPRARDVYRQILADYPTEAQAVGAAQAGLGRTDVRTSSSASTGDRPVWTGPQVNSAWHVSPDGRYITFVDYGGNTLNLMVHDVVTNTDRALTSKKSPQEPGQAWSPVFSKDGRHVAYAWDDWSNGLSLRIAPAQGNETSPHREILKVSQRDVRFLNVRDWSPDGQWVVAQYTNRDGTIQIVLVAVGRATAPPRQLRSFADWDRGPGAIAFSDDSRYIAYDLPAGESSEGRDVFVQAIDGQGQPRVVVPHTADDQVMGWSGRHLLIRSNRAGQPALWAFPLSNGQPAGNLELLRANVHGSPLGVTASGSLYVYRELSTRDVTVADLDLARAKLGGEPAGFVRGFLPEPGVPDWSPDGRRLAYQACSGGSCIAIRTVDTGEVRQVPQSALLYPSDPRWSPDGALLLTSARDTRGRNGLFTVNVETGETSFIVSVPRFGVSPLWSADGKKIYYLNNGVAVVERDLSSGMERDLVKAGVPEECRSRPMDDISR